MPRPLEYIRASEEFDAFLLDVMQNADFATRNSAYTTAQAVLLAFRSRLTVAEGLRFADVLPSVLRAIFVTEWNIAAAPLPFLSRAEMTLEVQGLRRDHNFSPSSAIVDVAKALRKAVDMKKFDAVLATLVPEARDYWKVD